MWITYEPVIIQRIRMDPDGFSMIHPRWPQLSSYLIVLTLSINR